MKARHLCAICGIAIAIGAVVFMQSLVATNDRQSTAVAERLLAAVPVGDGARVAQCALDYRPGGHVMQGPPMLAFVATAAGGGNRRPPGLRFGECVVTRALFAQRRLPVPPTGTELTLVGRKGAHRLKIAGVIDWDRPVRGYPNLFVSAETSRTIDEEWREWTTPSVADLAPGFRSDAGRNFDRAKGLLLWAAALTALALLINSLFLTVEARRKEIAVLRMLGLTRGGVARAAGEHPRRDGDRGFLPEEGYASREL